MTQAGMAGRATGLARDARRAAAILFVLLPLLSLLLSLTGGAAWAGGVAFVPVEHPVYAFVDLARAQGLLGNHVFGTLPWTRDRLRGVLESLVRRLDRAPSYMRRRLVRFAREFGVDPGEGAMADELREPPRREGTRIDGMRLRWARLDGRPLWNDLGRPGGTGGHALAVVDGRIRLAPELVFAFSGQARRGPDGAMSDEDTELELVEANLVGRLGPVVVMAGRQAMAWGTAATGNLLVSPEAKPVEMLRLESAEASTLHLLGRHLGRWAFFMGRLEEDRVVPEPIWAGMRFDFRSSPTFEWHLQRAWLFGGDRDPSVGFDLRSFLFGNGENVLVPETDFGNQLAGFGARFRGRTFGLDWEAYGEAYGEDLAAAFPTQKSGLYGIHLPALGRGRRLGLRFEHGHIAETAYAHHIYRSGYTHEGRNLGHAFAVRNGRFDWAEAVYHADARLDVALHWRDDGGSMSDRERGLSLRWSDLRSTEWRFDLRKLRSLDRPDLVLSLTRRW